MRRRKGSGHGKTTGALSDSDSDISRLRHSVDLVTIVVLGPDLEDDWASPDGLCGDQGQNGLRTNGTSNDLDLARGASNGHAVQLTRVRVEPGNGSCIEQDVEVTSGNKGGREGDVKGGGVTGDLASEVASQGVLPCRGLSLDGNDRGSSGKAWGGSSSNVHERGRSGGVLEVLGERQRVDPRGRPVGDSDGHRSVSSRVNGVLSSDSCDSGRALLDGKSGHLAQSSRRDHDSVHVDLGHSERGLNCGHHVGRWINEGGGERSGDGSSTNSLHREGRQHSRELVEDEVVQTSVSSIGSLHEGLHGGLSKRREIKLHSSGSTDRHGGLQDVVVVQHSLDGRGGHELGEGHGDLIFRVIDSGGIIKRSVDKGLVKGDGGHVPTEESLRKVWPGHRDVVLGKLSQGSVEDLDLVQVVTKVSLKRKTASRLHSDSLNLDGLVRVLEQRLQVHTRGGIRLRVPKGCRRHDTKGVPGGDPVDQSLGHDHLVSNVVDESHAGRDNGPEPRVGVHRGSRQLRLGSQRGQDLLLGDNGPILRHGGGIHSNSSEVGRQGVLRQAAGGSKLWESHDGVSNQEDVVDGIRVRDRRPVDGHCVGLGVHAVLGGDRNRDNVVPSGHLRALNGNPIVTVVERGGNTVGNSWHHSGPSARGERVGGTGVGHGHHRGVDGGLGLHLEVGVLIGTSNRSSGSNFSRRVRVGGGGLTSVPLDEGNAQRLEHGLRRQRPRDGHRVRLLGLRVLRSDTELGSGNLLDTEVVAQSLGVQITASPRGLGRRRASPNLDLGKRITGGWGEPDGGGITGDNDLVEGIRGGEGGVKGSRRWDQVAHVRVRSLSPGHIDLVGGVSPAVTRLDEELDLSELSRERGDRLGQRGGRVTRVVDHGLGLRRNNLGVVQNVHSPLPHGDLAGASQKVSIARVGLRGVPAEGQVNWVSSHSHVRAKLVGPDNLDLVLVVGWHEGRDNVTRSTVDQDKTSKLRVDALRELDSLDGVRHGADSILSGHSDRDHIVVTTRVRCNS